MKPHISFFILAAVSGLSSCRVGPDFLSPTGSGGTRWKQQVSISASHLPDAWWRLFEDAELNRLVERAISANNDIAAAKARLDTARSLVGTDRARLFPQLDVNSRTSTSRISTATNLAGIQQESQLYRATFDLSYDLDLWGRNRRRLEASQAEAQVSANLLDAQRLGIAAETARQYFVLRGLDAQERVLNETLETRRQSLELEKSRTTAGLTDGQASSRARTEFELARNDLANIQRQRGSAEHALAVLCGSRPSDFRLSSASSDRLGKLPEIRAGLPAEVIARRPDMRAAEQRLRAANARIGAAQAEFYPNISLTGSGGLESLTGGSFLDWESRVLSLGANLTAPLLDGGARKSNYDASRSQYEESMASYRQSLLIALREVEDALVDLQGLARSREALEGALASSEDTRKLSRERYEKGLSSYLEVVDADRSVLSTRLALAQVDAQQRVSCTALARALGGGWNGK